MKKIFIIIIFLPIFLTGCWDRKDLEELAYVSVIGVDKGKEEGMFKITYQIPSTESQTQGGKTQSIEDSSEIVTFAAPDYVTGRDLATASVTRRLNFSHIRVLIISQEVAKTPENYRAIFGSLREREFRRNTYILVSKEKAEDFIKGNAPKLESSPHKFYDYMSRRWVEVGLVPISTVNDFAERFELKSSLLLTAYGSTRMSGINEYGYESNYLPGEIDKTGGNPTQIIGSAVFKGEKMIGTLTGEETRLALLLSMGSKADNMHVTFPDPFAIDKRMTANLTKQGAAKVRVDISEDAPKIDVDVAIDLKLLSIPSKVNYAEDKEKQEVLKKHFSTYMQARTMNLIKKTQEELEGEPFQWSLAARKKFWSLEEFFNYNWMEKYPSAKIKVTYNIKLKSTGKQLKPPK